MKVSERAKQLAVVDAIVVPPKEPIRFEEITALRISVPGPMGRAFSPQLT
jgi:hypothetical protein